jgi:hypothetical protein
MIIGDRTGAGSSAGKVDLTGVTNTVSSGVSAVSEICGFEICGCSLHATTTPMTRPSRRATTIPRAKIPRRRPADMRISVARMNPIETYS